MNVKRVLVFTSIVLLFSTVIFAIYTFSYKQKIGNIYMNNMESLVRTLDSLDREISTGGMITSEENSVSFLNNAVLTDMFPSSLGIDLYVTELNNRINMQNQDADKIHKDIVLLRDAIMKVVYEQCQKDPNLIFNLQDRNNSITKEFISKTHNIIK